LGLALLALCWICGSSVAAAQGQGPSKEQLRAARALADAGFELFQAGEYQQSYDRFRSAEDIFHAPPHVMFMARSAAKLGRYVEARDLFASLANEELDPEAPKPFFEAKKEAAVRLEEVEAKIATLRVEVTGPQQATIAIDGTDRTAEVREGPVDLDPGEHLVRATAEGFEPAEQSVSVEEGSRDNALALELTPLPEDAPPTVGNQDQGVVMEEGPLWPAFVIGGVGVAAIGVGATMGVLAMGKASDLDAACPERDQCPPDNEGLESDARLFGNIATGMFIGGGVLAAGSVVWFILRPFGGPAETDGDAAARVDLTPTIGPGYVGLQGTF
jgi:hypothetical protein